MKYNQDTMLTEKICAQCGLTKPVWEYHLRKKNGRQNPRAECKECYRENSKKRYEKNKYVILNRNKKYYENNRDRLLVYRKEQSVKTAEKDKVRRKQYYLDNSEHKKAKRKEYYVANRESCIKSVERYIQENKGKVREWQRKHHHKKRAEDFNYKIMKVLRTRLYSAVKVQGVRKKSKTMDLIGCTIPELRVHLESKFLEGMCWANHSIHGWHIDHIIPCYKFDLTKEEEQRKCFHYSNLQPLWALDNLKKSNKIL